MIRILPYILFLYFFTCGYFSFSQSFIKEFKSSEDEFLKFSLEVPSGGYIINLSKGIYSEDDIARISERDILLKLDNEGNEIDSLVFEDDPIQKFTIGGMLKLNNENEFLVYGQYYISPNYNDPVSLRIIRLNYDLHLQHDTVIFSTPDTYKYIYTMIVNSDNHLMIPVFYLSNDYLSYGSFLSERTIDGVSIREKLYDTIQPNQHIVELTSIHTYNLINNDRIVEIDSGLNYVKTLYEVPMFLYEYTLFNLMTCKNLNDSSYLVEGNEAALGGTWNCAWGLFDGRDWANVYYFGSIDTTDFMSGMDFIIPNHIYSAIKHIPKHSTAFEMIDNQMLLYSTELSSNTNWIIRFEESGFILPGLPLATSDTGCLWMGNYWDWHHKTKHEYDAVLIKVNADGSLFTNLPEPVIDDKKISLFPNPGIDIHIYSSVNEYSFRLVDLLGHEVIPNEVLHGNSTISTYKIRPGMYLYEFSVADKIIIKGKWIKE